MFGAHKGRPCRTVPPPGWQWCLDHLFSRRGAPLDEEYIEALVQIVDGTLEGASTSQQLQALDLLGEFGGLASEPRRRWKGRK
jgi:hypothetical protein